MIRLSSLIDSSLALCRVQALSWDLHRSLQFLLLNGSARRDRQFRGLSVTATIKKTQCLWISSVCLGLRYGCALARAPGMHITPRPNHARSLNRFINQNRPSYDYRSLDYSRPISRAPSRFSSALNSRLSKSARLLNGFGMTDEVK